MFMDVWQGVAPDSSFTQACHAVPFYTLRADHPFRDGPPTGWGAGSRFVPLRTAYAVRLWFMSRPSNPLLGPEWVDDLLSDFLLLRLNVCCNFKVSLFPNSHAL
jgi:hypothetical protein